MSQRITENNLEKMLPLLSDELLEDKIYPQSDGRPMADNTLQYEWIVLIKEGLDSLLPDFVGADLFWYPVEGNPRIVQAPDVMVALGRPKGHRPSYKQWREDNIAPQIVFEILSPGNTLSEMLNKQRFYQRYGVEEYYVYNPDTNEMWGHFGQETWQEVKDLNGWVSPLVNIKFELTSDNLTIYHPNGERFLSYQEVLQQRRQLSQDNQQLSQDNQQLSQDNQLLSQNNQQLLQDKQLLSQNNQKLLEEKELLLEEKELLSDKANRLAEKLKALGIDPSNL